MFGPSFSDYYRKVLENVSQDILRESDTQILGSDTDELASYYFEKYALAPIKFDPSLITYEITKEMRTVPAHQRDEMYRYEGSKDFEYEVGVITLPIEPSPNLEWFKKLSGTTRYLDGFEEDLQYSQSEISYSFDIKGYGFKKDEDQIANEINSKSARIIETLNQKNSNIDSENTKFLSNIRQIVSQRKAKLVADQGKLAILTQKIKIPLKQKTVSGVTRVSIDARKFVHAVKPTPKLPEEYVLEESILADVLSYVENQCKTFETTPGSYKQLGEEQLRDIILSALNGIFAGSATGETFVKKGKTDIHLRIEKGEILIFECKIWGGEKLYLETIDQLIDYVTWRQNYGVVVMFCKNRDFSKILAQIPEIIQKHPRYVRGYKKVSEGHFASEHSLPEDGGKIIKIHHLVYNLFSE